MTISYTGQVANARLGAFSRLLFYWKGSIYKLMYKEMLIFCTLYAALSILYRFGLKPPQKKLFENIALYCETFTNLIPLAFVLGFYVAVVVTRWWNQYMNIPWPDRVMLYATNLIEGIDERGRIIRRTLGRYLTLGSLLVYQSTSFSVKKRFPTLEHLLEAGIITPAEVIALEQVHTPHGKWWMPFVWGCNLVRQARKEGRIADEYSVKTLMDEILTFRGQLGNLYSYDWISIPLVYTQVTTLATYSFFLGAIFGRQFLDPKELYPGHKVDLYIPIFTILQFFFYMGWLKVAEQLINPFGEDDDDFELNWIIDRNWQVSLLLADNMHASIPMLEKDLYFMEPAPDYLPYTKSSLKSMTHAPVGSTFDLSVSNEGMKVVPNPLETITEEDFGSIVGSALNVNNFQRCATPMSSPGLNRSYLNQNLVFGGGQRAPRSMWRSSSDSGSTEKPTRPFSGSAGQHKSYIENWLHLHMSSHGEGNGKSCTPHLRSEMTSRVTSANHDLSKAESMIFKIDIEDESQCKNKQPQIEEVGIPIGDQGCPPINQAAQTPINCDSAVLADQARADGAMYFYDNESPIDINTLKMIHTASNAIERPPTIAEERSHHSSSDSSWEFEKPDPHQLTVTSLTPLLKDMELCPKSDDDTETRPPNVSSLHCQLFHSSNME